MPLNLVGNLPGTNIKLFISLYHVGSKKAFNLGWLTVQRFLVHYSHGGKHDNMQAEHGTGEGAESSTHRSEGIRRE